MAVERAERFYLFHPAVGYLLSSVDDGEEKWGTVASIADFSPAVFKSSNEALSFMTTFLAGVGEDAALNALIGGLAPYEDVVEVITPDLVIVGTPQFAPIDDGTEELHDGRCLDHVPGWFLA